MRRKSIAASPPKFFNCAPFDGDHSTQSGFSERGQQILTMGKKRKHSEVADGAPVQFESPAKKKNDEKAFAASKDQKKHHGQRSNLVRLTLR
jgi:hypothetical protein